MEKIIVHRVKKVDKNLIVGATQLSVKEAEALPQRLYPYNNFWKFTPQELIRPALRLAGLGSSDLVVGDRFRFGGTEFEIVSDDLAFSLVGIPKLFCREDWDMEDGTYETSVVRRYVDEWLEASLARI